MNAYAIEKIYASEIISTSSYPTLHVTIVLQNGVRASASVPFGNSAGSREAVTLLDHDSHRYHGHGMLIAAANVNVHLAKLLQGIDVRNQKVIDERMVQADDTPQKSALGGNAILGVSLACARTASVAMHLELYEWIAECYGHKPESWTFPLPYMVVIEGGKHADQSTDFQEYLISPVKSAPIRERIRYGIEVYQQLQKTLSSKGFITNVGYEGAYAPSHWTSNEEPLLLITEAIIQQAGYQVGEEIALALDLAASEFYDAARHVYILQKEQQEIGYTELVAYMQKLVKEYSIFSLEDVLDEGDWEGWKYLYKELGTQCDIVGDDLTVSDTHLLSQAIATQAINAVIVKPNQIGTLSETLETASLAKQHNIRTIVSHRGGGETMDTFISDLAVAISADGIKLGVSRGERVEKYNRLMEIAMKIDPSL